MAAWFISDVTPMIRFSHSYNSWMSGKWRVKIEELIFLMDFQKVINHDVEVMGRSVGVLRSEVAKYMCFCHIIDSISLRGGDSPFVISILASLVISLVTWITASYYYLLLSCSDSRYLLLRFCGSLRRFLGHMCGTENMIVVHTSVYLTENSKGFLIFLAPNNK